MVSGGIVDLSIVIPNYNYGKYIEEAVTSIYKNRTRYMYEVIIVDDFSTDNSRDILCELGNKFPISVIYNKTNLGVAASRNIGISYGTGGAFMCLDADDYISKHYIQNNLDNIFKNNVDVSYGDIQYFGDQELYLAMPEWSDWAKEEYYRNNFVPVSSVFTARAYRLAGGYRPDIPGWEDYDFWLCALESGAKFKHCDNSILYYRRHQGSMIQTSDTMHGALTKLLIERHPKCQI